MVMLKKSKLKAKSGSEKVHLKKVINSSGNSGKIWEGLQTLLQDSTTKQPVSIAIKLLNTDNGLNVDRLHEILAKLLDAEETPDKVVVQLRAFAKHPDVLQHSWLYLASLDTGVQGHTKTLDRLLLVMSSLPVTTWEDMPLLVPSDSFKFDYQKVRKAMNSCWTRVMREKLTLSTRKHALTLLLENLLIHIEKPIMLTDFLMDSLDIGGPVSLLALQGVFTLIQEHNITYPNIYEKIYSLFDPEIFHTKYKARLFYLTDLFLSSTHLPEVLVGAFVKRVARLALAAPPQDIVISLQFIANLIIRHKGLKKLLNDPTVPQISLDSDPYAMEEQDPSKSNALESSLWEVEALTQHALPTVSNVAKNILKAGQRTEFDLAQVLELTETDIFEKSLGGDTKSYHTRIPEHALRQPMDTEWALY